MMWMRTCQLIFSPSITTMLVQMYRKYWVVVVVRTEATKGGIERRTYAGANFDSERMSRAVRRTISGVQERPYWGRAGNSKCTLGRESPEFKPPTTNARPSPQRPLKLSSSVLHFLPSPLPPPR